MFELIKRASIRWSDHEGWLLSAALAYQGALTLFPLGLVLLAGLGWASHASPQLAADEERLVNLAAETAGPWLAHQLGQLLTDVRLTAHVGGPVGLVFLVLSAMGLFLQFEYSLRRIWNDGKSPPGALRETFRMIILARGLALIVLCLLFLLVILMIIVDLLAAAWQPAVEAWPAGHWAWSTGRLVLAVLWNSALFAVMYRWLAPGRIRARLAFGGGLCVSLIWGLGQRWLSALLIGRQWGAYGVVGAMLAVMLWIYYCSAALLWGAELIRAWQLSDEASAVSANPPPAERLE